MRLARLLAALALSASALVASPAFAGTTVHAVRGELAPSVEGDTEAGWFRLVDVQRDGGQRQAVVVSVSGLDAGPDAVYDVVLENDAASAALGSLRLYRGATRGFLRYDTRKPTEDGVVDLSPFSGGTLRVRLAGADVLSAAIPSFVEPDGPATDETPAPSIAFGYGSVTLGDASDGGRGPVAKLVAFAGNGSGGVVQSIALGGFAFARGETYSLVLTGSPEDVVGSFKANWFGWAGLLLSTRRGDAIPGGSVAALAGRGVEVRDESGAVVLSGAFPALR
jgi:hypothetical protein